MILNHDSQLRAPHTPRLSDLGTAQLKIKHIHCKFAGCVNGSPPNLSPSQMKITIKYVVITSSKYIDIKSAMTTVWIYVLLI